MPALLPGHLLSFLFRHERADGLGGVLKGRIVSIHYHLRQHRGDALLKATIQKLLLQSILQIIADIALTHGHAHGQGHHIGRGFLLAIGGEGILDHAHLGAVAVGYHHRVPGFYQIRNGLGGLLYRQHLFRQIFAQRVAAQGDDDSFTHTVAPHS